MRGETLASSLARVASTSTSSSTDTRANATIRRSPRSREKTRARASDPFGNVGARSIDPFASSRASSSSTASRSGRAPREAPRETPTPRYRAWDDVDVYEVPERLRRPNGERNVDFVEYKSLEALFPKTRLAERFHEDAEFRTEVRRAMRDDLFVPDEGLSAERNAAMRSLSSSVHVNWFESRTGYAALSELFARHGVDVDGERFIKTLGSLCGEPCHGTLIDIASIGKQKIRHSWHQDSGYDRFTVMLGFPASTPSEEVGLPPGVGVFTHAVKLSHPLEQLNAQGTVIQWEDFEPYEGDFDPRHIARPVFRRGQEIMVYRDSAHLHSAPDVSHREAVWRFM